MNTIGKNILELRKEKGITQEVLAEVVGVTGQAVSKWESGGSPDIELLVPIAGYFEVSLDKLFSRNNAHYNSNNKSIWESINETSPKDEKLKKIFDYCWTMSLGFMEISLESYGSIEDLSKELQGLQYSETVLESGFSSLGINEELRYFLIMPEPEDGWKESLYFEKSYTEFFRILSDEALLKTLFLLYNRPNKAFTPILLERELGIDNKKSNEILAKLKDWKLVTLLGVELDDEVITTYTFNSNIAFVPLLIFAKQMLSRPRSFFSTNHNREKPLIK